MKNFYIAVQIQENDLYYAYGIRVNESMNLHSKLQIPGIVAANICPTKKYMRELVNHWNAIFKVNKTFLFQDGPLF